MESPKSYQNDFPYDHVEVNSLVLVKMLKHWNDNYPTPVNGQLLGLDVGSKLEVTNCFPYPQKKDIHNTLSKDRYLNNLSEKELEDKADEEFVKYQEKMMGFLHDVNVDSFSVGWYQTINFGELHAKEIIDNLVVYQETVTKAVMIGFHPITNSDKLSLKAYRIGPELLAIYSEGQDDPKKYNQLRGSQILIEVPIIIKNSLLIDACLREHFSPFVSQNLSFFDVFDTDKHEIEYKLNFLLQSLDALTENQEKFVRYQRDYTRQQQQQKQFTERRKLENEQRKLRGEPLIPLDLDIPIFKKLGYPSQLPTFILSQECASHVDDINRLSFENLSRLALQYNP